MIKKITSLLSSFNGKEIILLSTNFITASALNYQGVRMVEQEKTMNELTKQISCLSEEIKTLKNLQVSVPKNFDYANTIYTKIFDVIVFDYLIPAVSTTAIICVAGVAVNFALKYVGYSVIASVKSVLLQKIGFASFIKIPQFIDILFKKTQFITFIDKEYTFRIGIKDGTIIEHLGRHIESTNFHSVTKLLVDSTKNAGVLINKSIATQNVTVSEATASVLNDVNLMGLINSVT